MPVPLPGQASDPAAQQNFDEIAQYLSGTEQTIADAKLQAAIALKAADSQPAAQVHRSSDQTINTGGAFQVLTFDVEDFDNDSIHDNSTNNSRLTAQHDGLYLICGSATYGGITPGSAIQIVIDLNGSPYTGATAATGVAVISIDVVSAMTMLLLSAGDYVQLTTTHNDSSHRDCTPLFGMARLSPG